MNRQYLLIAILLSSFVILTLFSVGPGRAEVPKLEEIIPVPIHTMPVELTKIYRQDLNFSDVEEGLYVEELKEKSIFYDNGLRSGMVIRSINDRNVSSRESLIKLLTDSLDTEIELELWDTTQGETSTLNFHYELDRQQVVSYENGPLYHDPALEHSPDTESNVTYKSSYTAKVNGKRPCPVCHPGDQDSIWDEVISRGIGPTNPFVKSKIDQHGKVTPVSDFLKSSFNEMKEHRLRYQMKPRLIVLDTRKIFASGTPDGSVVLSKGILSYAEGLNQKKLLIAHMLAHVDARHPPRSVRYQQATNLLRRGINRVSDVGIGIDDVGDFLFGALGMTSQRRWQGLGYEDEHEREAEFLKYYYLQKTDVPLNIDRYWQSKRRDLVKNLHENWANYLVLHPSVELINDRVRWKNQIRERIQPAEESQ